MLFFLVRFGWRSFGNWILGALEYLDAQCEVIYLIKSGWKKMGKAMWMVGQVSLVV